MARKGEIDEKTPSAVWGEPLKVQLWTLKEKIPALWSMTGKTVGASFSIKRDETTIGRASTCAISLREDGVSRLHARMDPFVLGNDASSRAAPGVFGSRA